MIALVIFFAVPILITIAMYGKKDNTSTSTTDKTTSLKVVTNNDSSEVSDNGTNTISILNSDDLVKKGLTIDQIYCLKVAVNKVTDFKSAKYLSINPKNISLIQSSDDSEDGNSHIWFELVTDSGTSSYVDGYFKGISDFGIKLYGDSDRKQLILDSGTIAVSSSSNQSSNSGD